MWSRRAGAVGGGRPVVVGFGAACMFRGVVCVCGFLLIATVGVYALRGWGERADLAYLNSNGINTLDPASITWKQDIRVALNIWEGLTVYDPETSGVTGGAAALPEVSDDGRVYTFQIRADARWSNGDPVTADDYVRGWRRAIEPGTAGDYAFFLTDTVAGAAAYYAWRSAAVAELASLPAGSDAWRARFDAHVRARERRFAGVGLRAVDRRRLEVRLAKPCAYFLDLCSFVTLLPVHESIERLRVDFEGTGLTREGLVVYDPQWTKPDYHANGYPGLISNGAYTPIEWRFKRRLRMAANRYYHRSGDGDGGDRRVDRRVGGRGASGRRCRTIDMVVYGDPNTAIMAYEAGELDFLPEMGVSYDHELARLALNGVRKDFYCPPVFGTYYYLFNCADAVVNGRRNPFVDARVRKAFALAVDRELIASKVAGRGEPPTGNIVPVGSIAGYTSPEGLGYNPDEARRLLRESGHPGGAGLATIDLLYNTGFEHGKVCDVLAEMWRRELGVEVVPRGKEVKTFAEDRKQRRFMIARAGWYGDYGDPTTFLDLFATGNGNNDAGYSDPVFDDWLGRAADAVDDGRRMALLGRAEARIIRETVPALPLFRYTQLLAIKPYVAGLRPNPRLLFPFRRVRIRR